MRDYSKHFLLDVETSKIYAKEVLHYFEESEDLKAIEIGDGNINYVFKVWNPVTEKSVIIKQADTVLRSSGRPLDMHRNKIEAEILGIEGKLAPLYVPRIYHYDEAMYALSMEDISAYKNLRKELMEGKIFTHFGENISEFLVDTLLPTTDLVMDRKEKKEKVKLFTNPELCDISEDLVFTEPYYNYKNRNIILDDNLGFVEEKLYSDKELHAEVGKLRDDFMNHAQALIHGDLHSGSIFINEKGIKVIDPEFAFYGPMGYDIGNVIGNLFFTWANRFFVTPDDTEFIAWIEDTIAEIYDKVKVKLRNKFGQIVSFPLYNNNVFREDYIDHVMADALGYAGTEIIRRVVGDSKVMEVTTVEPLEKRIPMERKLIEIGIQLIKGRERLSGGREVVAIGKGNLK